MCSSLVLGFIHFWIISFAFFVVVDAHSIWLELIASSSIQFVMKSLLSASVTLVKKVPAAFLSIS